MVSAKASLPHEERTATEPRNQELHSVIVDQVTTVNSRIRTYKLATKDKDGINFLPGQWLDVHVPGIEKAGGFTITSPPRYATSTSMNPNYRPYVELAVQKSPDNPVAAWLWQPAKEIQGKELAVRVGGSFVWPPPGIDTNDIKRIVLIAGGVGINPLISILSHICYEAPTLEVRFLYSTKLPSRDPARAEILFLPRVLDLFQMPGNRSSHLDLFFSGTWDGNAPSPEDEFFRSFGLTQGGKTDTSLPVTVRTGRIDKEALSNAVGDHQARLSSVFYVCGPPQMTDDTVKFLCETEGVASQHVLCEKWW